MKFALAALLIFFSPSAIADESCGVFTHEAYPLGEVIVMRDGVDWVFVDSTGQRTKYFDVTGGTGVPQRGMRPVDGGESYTYRFIGDVLVIDMDVYEPYCP